MLNYNIKGTGLDLTDELRGYAEKKLAPAEKFLPESVHADIELEYHKGRHGDPYRAEFTLEADGVVHRVERWAESLHGAIDLATAEIVQELSRNKKKRIHVLRRSAHRVKEYLRGWRSGF